MSGTQPNLAILISFSLAWRFAPLHQYKLGIIGIYPIPNTGFCWGQKANLFQQHQKKKLLDQGLFVCCKEPAHLLPQAWVF